MIHSSSRRISQFSSIMSFLVTHLSPQTHKHLFCFFFRRQSHFWLNDYRCSIVFLGNQIHTCFWSCSSMCWPIDWSGVGCSFLRWYEQNCWEGCDHHSYCQLRLVLETRWCRNTTTSIYSRKRWLTYNPLCNLTKYYHTHYYYYPSPQYILQYVLTFAQHSCNNASSSLSLPPPIITFSTCETQDSSIHVCPLRTNIVVHDFRYHHIITFVLCFPFVETMVARRSINSIQ